MELATLHLPRGSARERGRAHGESLRGPIAEIAAIRTQLCQEQGLFRSADEVHAVAALHLPILERFDRALFEELGGIAEGAALPLESIVVLNHYTDLKDLDPRVALEGDASGEARARQFDEDCSAIVAYTPGGPALGQTWDMHGSAAPFVLALHVPEEDGAPEAWLLSITGCLGMAGMNRAGLGLTINNLRSNDARVGIVWPALVRRALRETRAEAARDVVTGAPLGSGHHYLVADARRAYGIETSGRLVDVWAKANLDEPGAGFHHENHCVGRVVDAVSSIGPTSTTLARGAALDASLASRPIGDVTDLYARLSSHDGHPRGICTHLASPQTPHAMLTCGGIVCDLSARKIWARAGCLNEGEPTLLPWSS